MASPAKAEYVTPNAKEQSMESDNENQTPEGSESQDAGVVIPEAFQKRVHELVHKASKHHLQHIRDRVSAREDELRKVEQEQQAKNKPQGMLDTQGMPD